MEFATFQPYTLFFLTEEHCMCWGGDLPESSELKRYRLNSENDNTARG
jgi:hypothetical protein